MVKKKQVVTRELALAGLELFSEFMGVELPEESQEKLYELLQKSIKLVQYGHLLIDEKGKATYKFQRAAPEALGQSVSFREPKGSDTRIAAKSDMQVWAYTASLIGQDEELLYLCHQKDANALTDFGMMILGG